MNTQKCVKCGEDTLIMIGTNPPSNILFAWCKNKKCDWYCEEAAVAAELAFTNFKLALGLP